MRVDAKMALHNCLHFAFKFILSNTQPSVWRYDRHWSLLIVAHHLVDMFGCRAPSIIFKPASDLLNLLLDVPKLQPDWSAQDVVLDSRAVDLVTPHQRVGEPVQETLHSQHRGALAI